MHCPNNCTSRLKAGCEIFAESLAAVHQLPGSDIFSYSFEALLCCGLSGASVAEVAAEKLRRIDEWGAETEGKKVAKLSQAQKLMDPQKVEEMKFLQHHSKRAEEDRQWGVLLAKHYLSQMASNAPSHWEFTALTFLGYAQHTLGLVADSKHTLDRAVELLPSRENQQGWLSRGFNFLSRDAGGDTEQYEHPFQAFISAKTNEACRIVQKLHQTSEQHTGSFKENLQTDYRNYCFFDKRLRYDT